MRAPGSFEPFRLDEAADEGSECWVLAHERWVLSSIGLLIGSQIGIAVLVDVASEKLLLLWGGHYIIQGHNNCSCVAVDGIDSSRSGRSLCVIVLLDADLIVPQSFFCPFLSKNRLK